MPELPEVETITRQLQTKLIGETIQNIRILWRRSVQNDMLEFKNNLIGSSIHSIFRRGKYICFSLDHRRYLTLHMGMTGKLLFSLEEKERKHLRIEFVMKSGCPLYFHDIRKFGKVRLWQSYESLLPELGIDPLEPERVYRTLHSLKTLRPVKSVLLDQSILAGIGNIYADETLYRVGIHPRKSFGRLATAEIKDLSETIPEILCQAIANMGTTISDYLSPDHLQGNNQKFLKVYGQNGSPCEICGTMIEKIYINNRSSHFCPSCQKE